MHSLAEIEIARTPWNTLRVMMGTAEHVPAALRQLLSATTAAEGDAAYWKLENRVVVQGQLYNSAEFVVPVLLAALLEPRPRHTTIGILELLFQIVSGQSHEDEVLLGCADLGDRCKARAREGIWVLYGELMHGLRESAQEIVAVIETDPTRLDAIVKQLPAP